MKRFPALIPIIVFCCSCSSTNLMSLTVTEPAPVSLPAKARTAAVVDRSRAGDDSKTVDAIHKAISLETSELQSVGAGSSITGLTEALITGKRFDTVKTLENLDLRSYGAGVFPVSLSWETVEKICAENHVDVLFSLELFDAEYRVPISVPALVPLGQLANVKSQVKAGWRIYDPATRTILDQFVICRDLDLQGGNLYSAGSALLGRKEAVIKAGKCAGEDYATRIIPYCRRVSRYYYVRGNASFGLAKRMAQAGDWDAAAKLWQQATSSPNHKVAGRACYNMAIIGEINGNLNGALEWAKKAYEMYGTPYALSYVNLLQQRQSDDAVLRSQAEIAGTP